MSLLSLVPTPDDTAWYDIITKFKNYAAKFSQNYNVLNNTYVDPIKYPELAKEKQDLLNRGISVKSTIQKITAAIDDSWNWLKSSFGFGGVRELGNVSPGLGIIPLIPIAAVAGAIALLTKWIFDYDSFNTKIEEMKRLEAKGYSPQQAAEIVDKVVGQKSWFNFGQALPVAFIAGLGLLAYLNRNKLR